MRLKQYKEDFFLLVEGGFIAVNQADEDSALKLFKAAEMLNPEHSLPKIGIGYLHLHKLELKQACKAFQDVIDMQPDNEMAKAFLGISMSMTPNQVSEGEQILHKTSQSKDPDLRKLCDTAIHFVDTFVKKTPGPAVSAKPEENKNKKQKHK